MNFKGHFSWGIVAAVTLTAIEQIFKQDVKQVFLPVSPEYVAAPALFFALFPDLDIGSVPQKWFYRCIAIVLLYLSLIGLWQLATYIGIIAVLPLLSKHRSWTHHPISTLVFPFLLLFFYAGVVKDFNWEKVWREFSFAKTTHDYGWVYIACVWGWWTHLLCDNITPFATKKRRRR